MNTLTPAKNKQTHVMIDIETHDTVPSAIILSIGARVLYQDEVYDRYPHMMTNFYSTIRINSQEGRTASQDTLNWWRGQPPASWEAAHCGTEHIVSVLHNFHQFCRQLPKNTLFWCKGVTFDFPILEDAMKEFNIPTPWKYYQLADCRTVFNVFKDFVPKVVNPNAHHAHADACCQAEQLEKCLNILNRLDTTPLEQTIHVGDMSWRDQFTQLKKDNELLAKKIAKDADKFTAIRNANSVIEIYDIMEGVNSNEL
jgi:hypothetical protein